MKKGSKSKFCRIHSLEFSSLDFCGFIRDNGSHCRNRVKKGDVYCHNHIGIDEEVDTKEEIPDIKEEIPDTKEQISDIEKEVAEPRAKCEYITLKGKKKITCDLFALKDSPYCIGHQKIQDEIDTNEKKQLKPEEAHEEDNSDERKKYISGVDIIASVTALIRKYKGNDDIIRWLDYYRTVLKKRS